ncbi:hypothetical protein vseg_005311 [Gypsophila vaccaria]
MTDKDSLRVHWVKTNYLKDQLWESYNPTSNSSWVWRKVCAVKNLLAQGFTGGHWTADTKGYTAAGGYQWLKGRGHDVPWAKTIWNECVIPKHQLLGWLFAQGALRTTNKLINCGLQLEPTCYLCGLEEESTEHMFFDCPYSRLALHELHSLTSIRVPSHHILNWCKERQGTEVQKGLVYAVVVGLVYHIWRHRNLSRNESRLNRPNDVVTQLVKEVNYRINNKYDTNGSIAHLNTLI